MKHWIAIWSLLAVMPLCGQTLEEETELLLRPRGEAALRLQQGQSLYGQEVAEDPGWYKVSKRVFASLEDWNGSKLGAGSILRNAEGDEIGRVLTELEPEAVDTVDPFRKDKRLVAILEAYVFKTKLARGSVPEARVNQILAMRNRADQNQAWDELWEDFPSEEAEYPPFSVRVIRASDKHLTEEADFRLIAVFRGSTLYALMTNDQELAPGRLKKTWTQAPFKILYFYNPTESQQELMEEILYTYLAL